MLGRRQVTPGWKDDPLRRQGGRWCRGVLGQEGAPPLEVHWKEGREGEDGQ